MNKLQRLALLLVTVLMGYSASLRAEDIDIYVDNAATAGVPNVLLVMDNGANFSANAQIGCSFYSGTSEVPSLGNSTGAGIEQCALVDAINSLPNGSVNIGILVSNASNFATNVRLATDTAYHELCANSGGGCVLRKLTLMTDQNKKDLIKFVKSWESSGQSTASKFNVKVNSALPGTMMQEAWAYYRGKIGMSGTNYPTSVVASGCQKNFIIYIANVEKSPAGESPSPYDGTNALTSNQVAATAAQKVKISENVTFNPAQCKATTVSPGTQASNWSENWADEWARLMFRQDGGNVLADGTQNIITYTVGVANDLTCTPDYPALLSTMAKYGGGKYFKTGNAGELTAALQNILNEVQAVNSVFSSASLPVSVNAEGTYLNQIFLGMFRPDNTGAPRWLGNLKQYQLVRNSSGNLIMGDAAGNAAISSAGTGFISPNAVSFWSKKDTATAPDNSGGFYQKDPKGIPASGFDTPDGEVVEKGGVAQQLRLENLTADFGAATTNNPRRLYTYCPDGSTSCNSDLTHSQNAMTVNNPKISATAFGASVDKDIFVKWLRGADNGVGEIGPGGAVTVRPSVHGDVLHSRPLVINYGDARGIVVFYGSNDGVFRAVNGNKIAPTGSVPAGGELWGLVLPEHFPTLNRQRLNSPELKFPGSASTTARPKDYFVDGPTGAYQKLKADGTIDKAYLYMTMRRGGRFMYALDVSDPVKPVVMWKISNATVGFGELGQTWSRPRLTLVQSGAAETVPTPVLIFGAGYDPAEDSEPPATDTMGRGVFVINALTGALIWSATPTCTTSATCLRVSELTHAIPSDIAFVDRDNNGYTDKLYFGDLGGNIWRADVHDSSTLNWKMTKVAALGCASGSCAAGTTPRKFFFPPSVLPVKAAGMTGSFDALSVGSGDREHPLKSSALGSSFNVNDRFFMILDRGTTLGTPVTSNVTPATLFNASTVRYDNTLNGFYFNLATGEKAVNAPLAVSGSIFFGTNRPIDRLQSCTANLGEAKAYAVDPFLGTKSSNTLPGGGLPPSAVTGLITIETTNPDGSKTMETEKFCIGCGTNQPPPGDAATEKTEASCNSALENCKPDVTIKKNLRRSYWYQK